MNRSLLSSFSTGTRRPSAHSLVLRAGLLLAACAAAPGAMAQPAAAPQAATGPQWDPAQVAKPELPKITTPQQIEVRDRATARWQALMAGDFAKSYTFTSSTFRKNTTEAAYLTQFEKKPQWHGAEVLTVTCTTPTSCVARVRMDVKISLPRTKMDRITTHGDETWLLEDGQWWFSDDAAK